MASLSDLIAGGGSGAPDAAATLLKRVHAKKGTYFYEPASPLAPGKYVVKHDFRGESNVHVHGRKVEAEAWNSDVTVVNIPESISELRVTVEGYNNVLGSERRDIRRFHPGGISTGNNGSTNPFTGSTMIANDSTGKIWIQVSGFQSTLRRSVDGGRTWQEIGRPDWLAGEGTTTNYDTYTINYFNGKFIYAAGPAETGTSGISQDGFSWSRVSTNLTTVTTSASSPTCYVAGRRVTAPGDNNLVYSFDGVNYTRTQASGFTGVVLRVFWTGTQFLAFDDGGRMTTSTDGRTWTTAVTLPFILRDITMLGSTFFAVSNAGVIYSSTNLSQWTATATLSTSTNQNHQIKAINNLLAYYDPNNGRISTSPDGVTWTVRVTGLNNFGTLNYNEGFIALDGQKVAIVSYQQNSASWFKTTDGIDWEWREQPVNIGGNTIVDTAFGAGVYVAVSDGTAAIATSTNGINWVATLSNDNDAACRALRFENSVFVASANSGRIITSTNGTNWTRRTTTALGGNNVHEANFGNGKWIAVGNTSSQFAVSTDNGVNWTNGSWSTGAAMYGVAWGDVNPQTLPNGVWVSVGDSGVIMRSTDGGTTWTRIDNVYPNTRRYRGGPQTFSFAYRRVIYAAGRFVAVGDRVIATSTDGLTWDVRDNWHFHKTNTWFNIRWDSRNNRYIIMGDSGLSAYSTNAIDWFSIPNGFGGTFVGGWTQNPATGRAIFVGGSGQVRDSNDGEYYFHYYSDFPKPGTSYSSYYGKFEDGQWGHLMTNSNGIYRTRDFSEWYEPIYNTVGGNNVLLQVIYANGVWVGRANSSEAIFWSPNGRNWAVAESGDDITDIRGYNIAYGDGYFWKIYRSGIFPDRNSTSNARLSRSVDGKLWYDYTGFRNSTGLHQQAYFPIWIKKVRSGYVAFGYSSGGDGRYFQFSGDLMTRRDGWETKDTGQSATNFQITDMDETTWGVFAAYANNHSWYSTTWGSNYSGTTASSLVYNADGYGSLGFFRLWRVGDRMFAQNGSSMYEIELAYSENVSTNTNGVRRVLGRYIGTWNQDQNIFTIPNGNTAWGVNGDNHYTLTAGVPATISIYNSTVEIDSRG